jgi:SAM-dependent methyltransferase
MTVVASGIEDVRQFWNSHPLWSGESEFEPGTIEYFEEHRNVVIRDCLAGRFDERTLPPPENRGDVLDLGCGPGFWTIELARRGCQRVVASDLTKQALSLTQRRCEFFGVTAEFSQQNAEELDFPDQTFDHVNCQGVIHHTPNTTACIESIARVLKPGGTASISVYYRNRILRSWPFLRWPVKLLASMGASLRGRGRESIYRLDDVEEIVRCYDGADNPIGKCYDRNEFIEILRPHFQVNETFLHFFPARTLPFPLPQFVHRLLDRQLGFMIYASVRKL